MPELIFSLAGALAEWIFVLVGVDDNSREFSLWLVGADDLTQEMIIVLDGIANASMHLLYVPVCADNATTMLACIIVGVLALC